jgi:hypothetical protein
MKIIDPKTLPFLPVDHSNFLVLVDSKSYTKRGRDDDDEYYDEISSDGTVVAKYHVWHHMSIYPPQETDQGWSKTSTEGDLIATGKKS